MVDVTSFRVVSPKAVSTPVFQLPWPWRTQQTFSVGYNQSQENHGGNTFRLSLYSETNYAAVYKFTSLKELLEMFRSCPTPLCLIIPYFL